MNKQEWLDKYAGSLSPEAIIEFKKLLGQDTAEIERLMKELNDKKQFYKNYCANELIDGDKPCLLQCEGCKTHQERESKRTTTS